MSSQPTYYYAGPTQWASLNPWMKRNALIREKVPVKPRIFWKTEPVELSATFHNVKTILEFWENNYTTSTYKSSMTPDALQKILSNSNTKCFGVFIHGSLVATIMSTSLTGNVGPRREKVRYIENCVISKELRGHKFMKTLFAWHDYTFQNDGPPHGCVIVWETIGFDKIPATICAPYSTVETAIVRGSSIVEFDDNIKVNDVNYEDIQEKLFRTLQASDNIKNFGIFYFPETSPEGLTFYQVSWPQQVRMCCIIGIIDTYKKTHTMSKHIYKSVFCCFAHISTLKFSFWPGDDEVDYIQAAYEAISKKITDGLIIIPFEDGHGFIPSSLDAPGWSAGPSIKKYLYNYLSSSSSYSLIMR